MKEPEIAVWENEKIYLSFISDRTSCWLWSFQVLVRAWHYSIS